MADYTEMSRQLVSHEDAQALAIEEEIERYQRPKWPYWSDLSDWPNLDVAGVGIAKGQLFIPHHYVVTRIHDEFILEICKYRRNG